MTKILATFLLLTCMNSNAAPGFVRMVPGLKKIGAPEDLADATVALGFEGPYSSWGCSGAFVSDSGHILLANHCLDECRFEKDGMTPVAQNSKCRVTTANIGQHTYGGGPWFDFEVLKKNLCSGTSKMRIQNGHEETPTPAECSRTLNEDAAVILPVGITDAAFVQDQFRCLQVVPRTPAPGETLLALGRPGSTSYFLYGFAADDANGNEIVLSSGELTNEPKCSLPFRGPWDPVLHRWSVRTEFRDIRPTPFTDVIRVTVTTSSGSSGGPLVDQNYNVLGVASFGPNDGENNLCMGSTYFQSLGGIKDGLNPEVFSCRQRRVRFTRPMNIRALDEVRERR